MLARRGAARSHGGGVRLHWEKNTRAWLIAVLFTVDGAVLSPRRVVRGPEFPRAPDETGVNTSAVPDSLGSRVQAV